MHASSLRGFLEHLRKLTDPARPRELSDADLLERFRTQREEAAFTLLVQRHGPTVLAVCRRILDDVHAAEDVFQAAFLVLVRNAEKIRKHESLAAWLHGVAARLARKAQTQSLQRQTREREILPPTRCNDPVDTLASEELRAALDAEIERLADKYRIPLILCYLADKTHEQAAQELGWPKSSVTARLAKARQILQQRLLRRGFTAPAGVVAMLLTESSANAALPSVLTLSTVRLAMSALSGKPLATTAAIALADSVAKGTALTKGIAGLTLLTALGFAATVGFRLASTTSPVKQAEPAPKTQVADAPRAAKAEARKPRLDLQGDPLPPGAAARLGTMRLRYASCMAFSPNGKIVATAQWNTVHLWDAASGKPLKRLSTPDFRHWVSTVAFSPDGCKVAVMDHFAHNIVVWNVDKENPLFTAKVEGRRFAHQMVMAKIVFSSDGKTLYTGDERTIHAWDAETGKETQCIPYEGSDTYGIVISTDGKRFATAGNSKGIVRLWDLHSGKPLHELDRHRHSVGCVAFSPDGTLLATGGGDRTVRLWDVKSGKEARKFEGHEDDLVAVTFTPDGKGLATANRKRFDSNKEVICLWDLKAESKKPLRMIVAPGVDGLEYSPDGKTLAWISYKQGVHLLDATTGEERIPFESHYGDVNAVAYSPDGRSIATASSDRTIRLWEADSGKPKGVLRGHTDAVNAVAFSPDGKWLVSGSSDGTGILWDVEKQKIRFPCKGHGNKVHALTFTPNSKTLMIGGGNRIIQSWDILTGKEHRPINGDGKEYRDHNSALAISHDGRLLASGGDNVRLHDASTGRLLRTALRKLWVTSLAFSPDGRTLACGGTDRMIVLWELASGKERARLPGHWNQRGSLAFSPDGKLLASGSHDPGGDMNKVVHVWELATGRELGAFRGHEQPVYGVAFSPDGKRLATAGGDATTLIWDLAAVAACGPHPAIDKRSLKSPLAREDLEVAWKDLAGDDAVKAQQAVWIMARAPRQAVEFLGQRLRPAVESLTARFDALLDDLDSDNFSTRERASEELTRLGTLVEARLRKKRAEKTSLEMRKRIERILDKLDVLAPLSGEELRTVRAVEALEQMDAPEATQLLRRLADGAADARLTREAAAAKRRLTR